MTDKIVLMTTCGSQEEADRIASALVSGRLAACATLLPGATSVYRWKGEVERTSEIVLLIKTSRALLEPARKEIERLHSYELPEVIALPIVDGSEAYLGWLDEALVHETSAD